MESIKKIDTPYGRVYAVKGEGGINLYPSVTTILSSEQQPWLEQLQSDIGVEALAKISENAANRGSVMHAYLENYLVCMGYRGPGDDCLLYAQKKTLKDLSGVYTSSIMEKGRNLFYNMLDSDLFVSMKTPLFSEKFVWSNKHRFAGTADFGYVDSTTSGVVIGDFKSASSPRKPEQIAKYKKQLGAYSIAYEERTGKRVSRAEIWISWDGGIETTVLTGKDLIDAQEDFLSLCTAYHLTWKKEEVVNYLRSLNTSKMRPNESES